LRRLPSFPFHVCLVGAIPILHFWEKNFRLLGSGDGLRLGALYAGLALLLLGLGRLVLRDWGRSGLVVLPLMLVISSGNALGGPWVAVATAAALILAAGLLWRPIAVGPANAVLNAVVLTLVVLPAVSSVRKSAADPPCPIPEDHPAVVLTAAPDNGRPDIYFILVDGMGQPAWLEQNFGIARGRLTAGLERLGFTFLADSHSNYPQTGHSTAATLNMAPIQALLRIPDDASQDRQALATLTAENRVAGALAAAGYSIVTVPSGYPLTRFASPDRIVRAPLDANFLELYLLNESVLPLGMPWFGRPPGAVPHALHRRRVTTALDGLAAARDGLPAAQPVFCFAHILAPHPPFVFGPGGAPITPRGAFSFGDGNDWRNANRGESVAYQAFWRHQAEHVVDRLVDTVARILAAAPRPPVIIIQGDHGPGAGLHWDRPLETDLQERMGIFNAWLLPAETDAALRSDLTSMNTFPVLFNALFGAELTVHEDQYWFAQMKAPYRFFTLAR